MTVEVLNTARRGDKQRRISPESWATALLYCCSTQDRDGLHPHEGARPGPTMTPLLSARQLSDYGFNRNGASAPGVGWPSSARWKALVLPPSASNCSPCTKPARSRAPRCASACWKGAELSLWGPHLIPGTDVLRKRWQRSNSQRRRGNNQG